MSVATAEPTQLKTNIKKLKRDNAKLIKGLAAEWALAWDQKMNMKDIDKSTPGWLAQVQATTQKYQKSAEELANAYVGTWGLVGEPPEPLPKPQLNASLLTTGPMAAKHHLSQHHDEEAASKTGKLQSLGAATRHVLNTERSVITNTAKKAPGMAGWQRVGSGTSTCKFCNKIIDGGVVQTEPVFKSHDHCHCVPQMITEEQAAELKKAELNKAKRIRAAKRDIKKLTAELNAIDPWTSDQALLAKIAELQAKIAKLQTKLHELENPGPAEDLTPTTLADQKAAAAKLAEAEELAKKKKAQEEAAAKLKQEQEEWDKKLAEFDHDALHEGLKKKISFGEAITEPQAKWLKQYEVELAKKAAAEAKAKAKAEAAAAKKAEAAAKKAAEKAAVEMAKDQELAKNPQTLKNAKQHMFGTTKLTKAEALALFNADPVKALSKAKVVNALPDEFEPKKKLIAALKAKKEAGELFNDAELAIWQENDPTYKAQKAAEEAQKAKDAAEAKARLAELSAASREGLEKLLRDPDTEYRKISSGREPVTFRRGTIQTWNEAIKVHTSDNMPVSVNRAVSSYRGSGYRGMNNALRAGESSADEKRSSNVLRNAIAERPIPTSVTVWRGVKNSTGRYNQIKPGDRITDSAFMSTSVEQRVAKNFAGYYMGQAPRENMPAIFEIYTPQGTPVLTGDLGPNQAEHELIFGPGTTYEITSVERREGAMWIRAVIVETPIASRT